MFVNFEDFSLFASLMFLLSLLSCLSTKKEEDSKRFSLSFCQQACKVKWKVEKSLKRFKSQKTFIKCDFEEVSQKPFFWDALFV
jgi:hypothetical protein